MYNRTNNNNNTKKKKKPKKRTCPYVAGEYGEDTVLLLYYR